MIKVKIAKDGVKGADDGATVRQYAKGVIYTVSDALGEVFIEAGEATEVEEEKQSVADKLKAKGAKSSEAADKAVAEKEAADKAVAEKEAADKAVAAPVVPSIGLPGLPKK
jgi:membrane protein involved in colicin uptake